MTRPRGQQYIATVRGGYAHLAVMTCPIRKRTVWWRCWPATANISARNWGLTTGIPTELVSVPPLPYREMQALSRAQLEVLFETSLETRWYPLWVLLGTTGLRIGEALGLKWSDVDLLAGRLRVRRALQRQRGRGLVFVEPKSVTSRRCVELPQLAIPVLKQQRAL